MNEISSETHVETSPQVREIKAAPFCWLEKAALRRLRDACDETGDGPRLLAVYLAFAELASDHQSDVFTASVASIASRAKVSERTVHTAKEKLRQLGLLAWQQNFIPGTELMGPSTYTLLKVTDSRSAMVAVRSANSPGEPDCRGLKNPHEQSPVQSENKGAGAPISSKGACAKKEDRVVIPPTLSNQPSFAAEWEAFCEQRRAMRKTLTRRGAELLLATLAERPETAVAGLQVALVAGWAAFRWDWYDKHLTGKEGGRGRETESNRNIPARHRGTLHAHPSVLDNFR